MANVNAFRYLRDSEMSGTAHEAVARQATAAALCTSGCRSDSRLGMQRGLSGGSEPVSRRADRTGALRPVEDSNGRPPSAGSTLRSHSWYHWLHAFHPPRVSRPAACDDSNAVIVPPCSETAPNDDFPNGHTCWDLCNEDTTEACAEPVPGVVWPSVHASLTADYALDEARKGEIDAFVTLENFGVVLPTGEDWPDFVRYALGFLMENRDVAVWLTCCKNTYQRSEGAPASLNAWLRGFHPLTIWLASNTSDLPGWASDVDQRRIKHSNGIFGYTLLDSDAIILFRSTSTPQMGSLFMTWRHAMRHGDPYSALCAGMILASILLHELLHLVYGLDHYSSVASCSPMYRVEAAFLWAMKQRYPRDGACCTFDVRYDTAGTTGDDWMSLYEERCDG
jgi:hypothetical protein